MSDLTITVLVVLGPVSILAMAWTVPWVALAALGVSGLRTRQSGSWFWLLASGLGLAGVWGRVIILAGLIFIGHLSAEPYFPSIGEQIVTEAPPLLANVLALAALVAGLARVTLTGEGRSEG